MTLDSGRKQRRPTEGPRDAEPQEAQPHDAAALGREIDRLDGQLVALLNERAKVAVELEQSAAPGTPSSGVGTDDLLSRVASLGEGPLSAAALQAIYRELISGWRAQLRKTRVAFLGPAYTYSHLAALEFFGQSVTRLRVRICGEVPLPIHHSLLGSGPRSGIVEVQSKPQALSQCRNWLARHLPGARLVEVASTVAAAQTAKTRPEIAAIAGAQAGAYYGLDVLVENIEDNASNVTRFFVIGHESAPKSGDDKMSAMFEVPHKPGALADAMNIFKKAKLNLTWIESFPISRPEGGYMFFIELDGHETDAKVKKALKALEKKTLQLEVLGSYPRAKALE
jgi:chorismate mutase/prephenate dehydratase